MLTFLQQWYQSNQSGRVYFQKIKCRHSFKRHSWNVIHVFKLLRILRHQKERGAQNPIEYFLFYMHAVFSVLYFFFKSMTQRMKTKCVSTDHESLVVSITPLYIACIIYIHNINIGFQNFWVAYCRNEFNSWNLIFPSKSTT